MCLLLCDQPLTSGAHLCSHRTRRQCSMYVVIMASTVVVLLIFMMHDYHRCIAATAACAAHVAVPQSHPDLLQHPAAVIWQDGGVRAQPGGTAADVHKVRRPYPICTDRYTLFNFLFLLNVPRTRLHLACWALYWTRTGVAHAAAEPISALLCQSQSQWLWLQLHPTW